MLSNVGVYFSDFFDIDEDIIESYGAVNISLINDLPLFIDPFLLFNSERIEFQRIHQEMISYLLFLQVQAEKSAVLTAGMRKAWFSFSEVKQTWLGFSLWQFRMWNGKRLCRWATCGTWFNIQRLRMSDCN